MFSFTWRPIFLVQGILLIILSLLMLLPSLWDAAVGNPDAIGFLVAAAITLATGIALYLMNRGFEGTINIRQAFLLTATSWFVVPGFAALPLCFSSIELSYVDAFFETSSAFTTTGSTVISGLDTAPPGVHLWRGLCNWLGGIGIIVLAVAILPLLRIGGMQLFRTESSDKTDKILPRARQVASIVGGVYTLLTVICIALLMMCGFNTLDATVHAMATLATGGFSTKDLSVAYYQNLPAEIVMTIFMFIGSLPFVLIAQAMRGFPEDLFKDKQVFWFTIYVIFCILATTCWLVATGQYSFGPALRVASFNIVSVISTCGFATADFSNWGPFAVTFIFLIMSIGGCTGSTAGGVKMFRLMLLTSMARVQLGHMIRPHAVLRPTYNGKSVDMQVCIGVMGFCILYAACFLVIAAALSLFGLDFITSMSGAATALANVGPGLGATIGPATNFGSLPDGAKIILSIGMILGRLELFTLLILFTPVFWRE